jgi:hypothetical protein
MAAPLPATALSLRLVFLTAGPGGKGPQHPRVSKEAVAELTQYGAGYDALHVASPGNFRGRDVDLAAIAVSILDCCSENQPIESRPKCIGHAHGARLTGGIKCVSLEGMAFEFFACETDGAQLGMGGGVVFPGHGIASAGESLPALAVDDEGAEGHRPRCAECASGVFDQRREVGFIHRGGVINRRLSNAHAKV